MAEINTSNVNVLNDVLKQAGLEKKIQVKSYDLASGLTAQVNGETKTFMTMTEFFNAANRLKGLIKPRIFSELPSDGDVTSLEVIKGSWGPKKEAEAHEMVLVDYDQDKIPDFILYCDMRYGSWEKSGSNPNDPKSIPRELLHYRELLDVCMKDDQVRPKIIHAFKTDAAHKSAVLIKTLSEISWKDLGIPNSAPGDFKKATYAFDLAAQDTKLGFLSPLDLIKLDVPGKTPPIEVPWYDPDLLMAYVAYLQSKGLEVSITGQSESASEYVFKFKGLTVMRFSFDGETSHFKMFTPLGNLDRELIFKNPTPPKLEVLPPQETNNPNGDVYQIKVNGYSFKVISFSDLPVEKILGYLKFFPKADLKRLSEGYGDEKPVQIVIGNNAQIVKALDAPYLAEYKKMAGLFIEQANTIWINTQIERKKGYIYFDDPEKPAPLYEGFMPGTISHEMGHALDNSLGEANGVEFLSPTLESGFGIYYQIKKWIPSPVKNEKDLNFQRRFLSDHAAENSVEYFATDFDVYHSTYFKLSGYSESLKKEPTLKMIMLANLFDRYEVQTIGKLKKQDLYTGAGFFEVLGTPPSQRFRVTSEKPYKSETSFNVE